ncbi:MAG: A/G-specific adenine glycosylase [Micavibrio aeruginosavorus]|uniref:Adenine DNA glycosylase n=1 Tax=Micavibrio aeruginosavorus TaxID=349221 RepID=A0A2W5FJC0_9BACT|nr:MAG: A/G-specific adenine glycosylase [Micavibrio aeruginosavorus]
MIKSHDFQKNLLKWYDKNRRDLPWRAKDGIPPNPYHVWLSEIMLQQTTVPTVIPYFQKFIKLWPNLQKFAVAKNEDIMREWAGLGYYARARNLHRCSQVLVETHASVFPDNENDLLSLPGVGPYTAAAISAIAFDNHAVVIDGNVDRIVARVFAIREPIRMSKPVIREKAAWLYNKVKRPGDFAQSLMDLGATICVPQKPRCHSCPVNSFCEAFKSGLQNTIPVKLEKTAKPQSNGRVYWIENKKGEVLIERRDDKRMLGGMAALPTSGWDGKADSTLPNGSENRIVYLGDVYHSFTHFDLKLEVWKGISARTSSDFVWVKKKEILSQGFPTVFKKAVKMVMAYD